MHESKQISGPEKKDKPKSFYTLGEKTLIKKDNSEQEKPKESSRILTAAELWERKRYREQSVERKRPKIFNVWFVAPRPTLKTAYEIADRDKDWYEGYKKDRTKLTRVMHEHNLQKTKKKEEDIRPYYFDFFETPGDLIHNLEMAYDTKDKYGHGLRNMPEIIILFGKDREDIHGLEGGITTVRFIRQEVSKYIARHYGESESRIDNFITQDIIIPFSNSFRYSKEEINKDTVLEYGILFLEQEGHYKQFLEAAINYIKTGKDKFLEKAFSDQYLEKIFNEIKIYNDDDVQAVSYFFSFEDTDDILRGFEDEEDYAEYRDSIVKTAEQLDFNQIKEKMRKLYVKILKQYLDEYREKFEGQEEFAEWESNLLLPIIVTVSKNFAFNENNLENGANLAIPDFKPEDMEKLIQLASKIKSNPASLATKKLSRLKGEFYKSVEDLIQGRAEITADTKQELEILTEIFEKNNIENILDVGCGYGRICIPLIEQGYLVDGIDANEKFLEKIDKQIKKGELDSGLQFSKGNIMDYTGPDPEKKYQAVIYTWNTILEAFGPGNFLKSLNSAWRVLEPGGMLVFDQPTRENSDMADGWYGHEPEVEGEVSYLSYIMTEEELKFVLRIAGFENVQIKKWTSKPTEEYPQGVKKMTVSAKKPKGKRYKEYIPRFDK